MIPPIAYWVGLSELNRLDSNWQSFTFCRFCHSGLDPESSSFLKALCGWMPEQVRHDSQQKKLSEQDHSQINNNQGAKLRKSCFSLSSKLNLPFLCICHNLVRTKLSSYWNR
jgi:hypothetical protein